MNYSKYLLFVLLFITSLAPLSADDKMVELNDQTVITLDQGQLSFYRDPTNKKTFAEIQQLYAKGEFKALKGNLGAGYVPDAFWLTFSLQNNSSQNLSRWLEVFPFFLDRVELFHLLPNGEQDHRLGGDFTPQSQKEENYRGTLFKLDLSQGQHQIYLRLKTSSTMASVIKIWQAKDFVTHSRTSYFIFGLYFSLILAVLIFNAVNFIISRRGVFLAYVGFLVLNSLQWFSINGFTAQYLFPQQPLLANLTLGVTLSLATAMAFLFFTILYELKKYHPFIYRFNMFSFIYCLVVAIATFTSHYQLFAPWMLLLAIISLALTPIIMLRLWRTKMLWNRLLVIAHFSFLTLVSLNILNTLAIIPFNETLNYVGMISTLFHIMVLHVALLLHLRRIEHQHTDEVEKRVLAEKQVELEKSYREDQQQLLTMLTHEIRTPIAMIDASNKSLKMLDEINTNSHLDRERRYQQIHTAINRMNMIIDMVLAQKEDDNLVINPEPVDIFQLTKDVIKLSNQQGGSKRLQVNSAEESLFIEVDLRMFRIVLLNLIDNALKYSYPNTTILISIQSIKQSANKQVLWEISDEGKGIPVGLEKKIFNKFYRVDESSDQPGIGVGLFLVDRITAKHQGTITAHNSSEGAVFSLYLPQYEKK